MNFRVPLSEFKITLSATDDEKLVVVLTKDDPKVEEWGNYKVVLKFV